MSNKITFGLRNVHVAFEDALGYEEPVKIPGAVNFTPSPEGDTNTFYADDEPYYVFSSNNGYTGDLEMANFPDEVLAKMLGWPIDDNGMLVEVADATPTPFALMGEVQGDKRNRRFVYYKVQANRPSSEHATKQESVDPQTKTLPVTIIPVEIDGVKVVKGDLELSDTNKTVYDGFFDDVYLPDFATGS